MEHHRIHTVFKLPTSSLVFFPQQVPRTVSNWKGGVHAVWRA
jgi:hypothetical protein